jgi:hypothetical protein
MHARMQAGFDIATPNNHFDGGRCFARACVCVCAMTNKVPIQLLWHVVDFAKNDEGLLGRFDYVRM